MEDKLISFCAPTLAGIKTGSIFNMDISIAEEEIRRINGKFNNRDIYVTVLAKRRKAALIYVYRRKRLDYDLSRPKCKELMEGLGYYGGCIDRIEHLKERIVCCESFPHEIGLFLSYPPEDVEGFIENKGENALLCGYWKVYGNAEEAKKKFNIYSRCTRIYSQLFSQGRPFEKFVVGI